MQYKVRLYLLLLRALLVLPFVSVHAQGSDLAAVLEVLNGTVEVNRVNTEQWIAVKVEAIVGVEDRIRTDATGTARITFFADGVETELLPSSEIQIDEFNGTDQSFALNVEVIIGQTAQRIGRALDASSSYLVTTPGMSLAARGTAFNIRVEAGGRSAMLVSEGTVAANKADFNADVPPEFGIRAALDGTLSDVVRATSFDELDSALDGCRVSVSTTDDVSLNVRVAPQIDASRVGFTSAAVIDTFIGVTESGDWYRIEFRGGFGWILSSTAVIQEPCAGLRVFPNDQAAEDATLYESLGEEIALDQVLSNVPETPTVLPEPTPGT